MRTIGNDALNGAGEGVENRGTFPVVNTKAVAYLLGNASHGDNGNGIVGCAEIDKRDESCNSQFGTPLGGNVARESFNDIVDTSVVLDDFQQASSHHRNDNQFAHALDTIAHGAKPSEHIIRAIGYSDNARQDDAQRQYSHDVHTENGRDENGKIGNDLGVGNLRKVVGRMDACAQEDVSHQHKECCWNDDERIDAELIAEFATLCGGGHNRGV